jgi:hypothetical protein
MANITEILGTDSVSSSRPVINNNFELLNDDIAAITALLDPTTATLSGLTGLSTQALTVAAGGSTLATVNANGATLEVDTTFNGALVVDGKLVKSGVVGSAAVPSTNYAPTSIAASTYFVDNAFTVPAGDDGQEFTLINRASGSIAVNAAVGASLAVTSIALDGANSTVTLRCFNNVWYVISSYAATIL